MPKTNSQGLFIDFTKLLKLAAYSAPKVSSVVTPNATCPIHIEPLNSALMLTPNCH